MACAANFAFVNRTTMTFLVRQAFGKIFNTTPDDLDMHLIYDVRFEFTLLWIYFYFYICSHNIAKIEEHIVDGKQKTLLVHRKGATRAFPPHHRLIPVDYQLIGQPVLIGGTMGTNSYVLTGTQKGLNSALGPPVTGQADFVEIKITPDTRLQGILF